MRATNQLLIGIPVVLGAIAGISAFQSGVPTWVTSICALGAGIVPALGYSLKFETRIDEISRLASEYKVLQTRFRQLADSGPVDDLIKSEILLRVLTDRYESAISSSLTPPEWAFLEARGKIKSGHYDNDSDK